MSQAEPVPYLETALTAPGGHSCVCANPFCDTPMADLSPQGKHRRYCCDHCRLDGHALRRAKELLNQVGIVRFHALLDRV